MVVRNRAMTLGADVQIIKGIEKDLQAMPALYLAQQSFTPQTLAARIQQRVDAANAILAAKAAWLHAIDACHALDASTDEIVHDLKNLVVSAFGPTSPELADFGFAQRRRPVLTEAQKAAAVLKRAATRKARGTMGPKARLVLAAAKGATDAKP